jgi:DNA-binding MarR family transcriptional regulator
MQGACFCTSLRAATRRLASAYDAALAPVGLNIAQFSLLRRIARLQPVSLTQLGEAAELERSTVGRNVRVLARDGFVALDRGEDQREAVVSLTRQGQKMLDRAAPLWEACQRQIEARVGREEMRGLKAILEKI